MNEVILLCILAAAILLFIACVGIAQREERNNNSELIKKHIGDINDCKMYSYGEGAREVERYCINVKQCILYIFSGETLYSKITKINRRHMSIITKCEMSFDDTLIQSTNRGSQFLGAAVGGLAFGGVGAIVGGLSGTKETRKGKVSEAKIILYYDDVNSPIDTLKFKKNDYQPLIDIETAATEIYATILACMSSSNTHKCPFCAEDIKKEAIVCKHCGRDVEPEIEEKETDFFAHHTR